jgi:hypothetical protein
VPPLLPENEDAEKVYLTVRDQYIMAPMGGPVSINQLAIHEAIRLYGVEYPQDCFEKVVMLGRHFIGIEHEKAKEGK